MSEYWKSTPKYWCKHCKTYVRDTKLEKQNHDATPKHQGNIKRFLRDLHRGNERDEREKQRAKDEVARLNGTLSGPADSPSPVAGGSSYGSMTFSAPSVLSLRQTTPAERKKQLAQLAELGVTIPDDYRREVAMAGDWEVLSERIIREDVKKEEGGEEKKPSGLNVGVRKRKLEGQEAEEIEGGQSVARRVWGSATRTYPVRSPEEDDIDGLLATTTAIRKDGRSGGDAEDLRLGAFATQNSPNMKEGAAHEPDMSRLKKEESLYQPIDVLLSAVDNPGVSVKVEDEVSSAPGVVFRKRKTKSIRQQ